MGAPPTSAHLAWQSEIQRGLGKSNEWLQPDALVWRRKAMLLFLRGLPYIVSFLLNSPRIPVRVCTKSFVALLRPRGRGSTPWLVATCSTPHVYIIVCLSAGAVKLIEDFRVQNAIHLNEMQGMNISLPPGKINQHRNLRLSTTAYTTVMYTQAPWSCSVLCHP